MNAAPWLGCVYIRRPARRMCIAPESSLLPRCASQEGSWDFPGFEPDLKDPVAPWRVIRLASVTCCDDFEPVDIYIFMDDHLREIPAFTCWMS
jgi:hypothetical protein